MFAFFAETLQTPASPICSTTSAIELLPIIQVVAPILTIILAIVNLIFAIYFFVRKDRKEIENRRGDIRIAWFKALVLDPSMKCFYAFFEELDCQCRKLTVANCSEEITRDVAAQIQAETRKLRQ